MNDTKSNPQRVPPEAPEPQGAPQGAHVKKSRWLGWIWLLPVAAVGIVGYLGIKALLGNGPTVHVVFASAANIKAGDTKVKFHDQEVGEVESVTLQKDLKHTDVVLSLHSQLEGHLGPDSRFWIEGGNLSLNDLSELKTLIAGPFIGIDPKPGKGTDHFTGLQKKPLVPEQTAGHHYHLKEAKLGTISRGSPVLHLGVKVGEVLDASMDDNKTGVDVEAFVYAPYDQLVHTGTRFWDASAVQLASGDAGPTIKFQSLPALVSGAVAFETSDEAKNQPQAGNDATFTLYDGQQAAENAPSPQALAYRVTFANPSAELQPNAGVTLADKRIGAVGQSSLDYDEGSGKLLLHATLMLEPSLAPIGKGAGDARQAMDAMLRSLIAQGLRAGLDKSPPLVGSQRVALRFVPNAPKAELGSGDAPEIPTTSGSGVEDIMAQASSVMAKVDALPLDQIGDNIRQATDRIAALSTSPQVTDALRQVSEAIANVRQVSASAKQELPAALASLRRTVRSAQAVIGQQGEVNDQPDTSTVPATLYEVRRAARSIRELADMINRNPQALLTGK